MSSHLYVFKTKDGSCIASVTAAGSSFLAPPSGMQGGASLNGAWTWTKLHVVDNGEVREPLISRSRAPFLNCTYPILLHVYTQMQSAIILTCASSDSAATSSTLPLNDAEDDSQETTRVTIFMLSGMEGKEFGETSLQKLGEWSVDGPADGVGLVKEVDGTNNSVFKPRHPIQLWNRFNYVLLCLHKTPPHNPSIAHSTQHACAL